MDGQHVVASPVLSPRSGAAFSAERLAEMAHALPPCGSPPLHDAEPVTAEEYATMAHALPSSVSLLDYATFLPRALAAYFSRLSSAFGWRYVAFVVATYGLNQGLGESFAFFSVQYLLTDPRPDGLELAPERYAAVDGFSNIPWQMKAIYGMVSDLLPICGYHRSPYITLAALAGTASFSVLTFVRGGTLSAQLVAALLLLANFSMASPDVMIDASMAERSGTHPLFAPDLQALAWGSFSVFQLVGSFVKGHLLDALGTRALFAFCVATSAVLLLPSTNGWLRERKHVDKAGAVAPCCGAASRATARSAFADPIKAPILQLSLIVCALSFSIGGLSIASESATAIWAVGVAVVACVCAAILFFERKVSLVLAKASVFIFLGGALQPSTPVMFYWYRESDVSCTAEGEATWRTSEASERSEGFAARLFADTHNAFPRPCFDPQYLGWMSVAGYASFALGTVLYHRCFTRWSYRSIWRGTQIIFVLLNLLDYVWVSRWNLVLGIPDKAFILGEEILTPVFSRLSAMPLFILAARLCPRGIEGTLFALTMGLSNFGGRMGSILGIGLLDGLGGVEAPAFTNMRLLVVIRSLTRALPLLLIPFLVPPGSPSDPAAPEEEADTAGALPSAADGQVAAGAGAAPVVPPVDEQAKGHV